jgi:hypothetical protein
VEFENDYKINGDYFVNNCNFHVKNPEIVENNILKKHHELTKNFEFAPSSILETFKNQYTRKI